MGYVVCGGCAFPIPPRNWNAGGPIPCPMCARNVEVMLFAAAAPQAPAAAPERVVTAGEASCYNHSMNRAAVACDSCGRFLCTLCDIPVDAFHVCPACLESGQADVLKSKTVNERVNYDSIALALVTLPMLLCSITIVTTPLALFIAFRHWNQPSPVMKRSRWRLWVTVAIAALQVIAVLSFFLFFYLVREVG